MTELAVLHVPRWTVLLPFEDKLFADTTLRTFSFYIRAAVALCFRDISRSFLTTFGALLLFTVHPSSSFLAMASAQSSTNVFCCSCHCSVRVDRPLQTVLRFSCERDVNSKFVRFTPSPMPNELADQSLHLTGGPKPFC